MGLTGFGVFFLFFGMMLFFDKALLAIGNVSWSIILSTTSPSYDLWDVLHPWSCCPSLLSVQILFVTGLSFVIGLERTFRFFFQRHKAKATTFFLGGVFVVLIGWPIIGVVLEIYGFFLLFRSAQTEIQPSPYHCYPELVLISGLNLLMPSLTGDSSRWQSASSDEFLCSAFCSAYQGSVQ